MRWYHVFSKGVKEQLREIWILVMIVVMAPLFIGLYYLMSDTGSVYHDVQVVNLDRGYGTGNDYICLGDSLFSALKKTPVTEGIPELRFSTGPDRETGIESLKSGDADVLLVLPESLTLSVMDPSYPHPAKLELVGDVTSFEYLVGAVWSEEIASAYLMELAGISLPFTWTETTLGHSGTRTEFELYVPGLLILSVIMIIFSASAAIVREPETRTLERLKLSRLTAFEFLAGISLLQLLIAALSLALALLAAVSMGYTIVPGTLGFLFLIGILTALSMVSFSLIVAAMCRSIKEVAIIGTFPLFLLMFFTGAAFPISGGRIGELAGMEIRLNQLLSPTWAVDALHMVLVTGQPPRETLPHMGAILLLSIGYFVLGSWWFRIRHMRAQ